jgi:DNA-binding XRE family transcriptional regulator
MLETLKKQFEKNSEAHTFFEGASHMDTKKKATSKRVFKGRPERVAQFEEVGAEDDIARKIYELRAKSKLTQTRLAKLLGTSPSAICRLEDSSYQGHSLTMLKRIAAAFNKRVEIRFVPQKKKVPAT